MNICKRLWIVSFTKNMSKNISKNISKNLNDKYSPGALAAHQKLLYHAKQPATDALKTASKRVIQENSRSNW